jgi:hypothetical protein
MEAPGKTLPQLMQSPAMTKAVYRFLNEEGITYTALVKPHWEATRKQMKEAGAAGVVLLVQDLSEVDYTRYPSIEALGPIGDGRGRGYLMSTVLAVVPEPRQVLGMAYQEPFLRQPKPVGETRTQRTQRPRESDFWLRGLEAIGPCPTGQLWVHTGDAGSDIFRLMVGCRELNCHFLLRACQNRKMEEPDGSLNYVLTFARQLSAVDERVLALPAGHGHPAREVQVKLAFSPLTLIPNWLNRHSTPIRAWVVRVWEENPPPAVPEPIDWILLTSLPTETVEQAWRCVAWYGDRWLVEDYHQCLKTGCQIEQHHLQHKDSLLRLLGLLAPVAVQLLSLREQSRLTPDKPANRVLPGDLLRIVAHLGNRPPDALTLNDFWRLVAQQGGYLGRKRDGPPGWKSIWTGWLLIQNLLRGAHLAKALDL